jgi:hypothetical protein
MSEGDFPHRSNRADTPYQGGLDGITLTGCIEIGELMEPELDNMLHLLNPLG